ncbi:MAG: adenylate/guanylate cyclase domain-containing protein, partial [Deltaproteobacteria bacterium]|nr:adenylate/guanylate cyclase domain-containing protein [Deltaproteobacteria bacterium]
LTLSGEEREITVLFSDIRNFTSLSEKMIPDELCTFLNEYLTSMTQILMDNRATVDKFIGDEIMAFWNAPLYDTNHSKNACLASLQMIRSIEQLNREWESQGKNPITFGIGLHTGIARVGNMGSEQRFDYTVMGDTVNIASRLQEATRLYNVTTIVSETTHSLVKNQGFVFRELDKIRVMGKENPVTIFELIEEQTRVSSNVRQELESHHKALAAYYAGEFETAHKRFKQLDKGPHGTLYQLYMKRCRAYLKNPPPQPWNGITTLKTK